MKRRLAVIFDMDGVILDSEWLMNESWRSIARMDGLQNMDAVLERCTGLNRAAFGEVFCEQYGEDFPVDEYLQRMREEMMRMCGGVVPTKPGAAQALSVLRAAGIMVALATSTSADVVRAEPEAVGLLEAFVIIVTGNVVKGSQPPPDIFLLTAELLGVKPECCLVVEDSYNGVRAAKNAGMRPIMVPDVQPVTEEMEHLAEWILPSLKDVQNLALTLAQ